MAQTTEERIAQIAQGFGQGFQNFQGQQDRQRAMSLQDEALKRQRALQDDQLKRQGVMDAISVSNTLGTQTGRFIDPSLVAPMVSNGSLGGIGDLMKAAPLTRKSELEAAQLIRQGQKDQKQQEVWDSQINKNNRPPVLKPGATPEGKVLQKQLEKIGTDNVQLYKVRSAMTEALKQLQNPAISEDAKIKAGQGLLKLLNSAEGSDAVGAEEAQRLGSFLEFQKFNLTNPGPMFGRDIKGFTNQIKNYADLLGGRIQQGESAVNTLKGGGTLGGAVSQPVQTGAAAPVRVTPQQVNTVKQMSDEELLRFVQGG